MPAIPNVFPADMLAAAAALEDEAAGGTVVELGGAGAGAPAVGTVVLPFGAGAGAPPVARGISMVVEVEAAGGEEIGASTEVDTGGVSGAVRPRRVEEETSPAILRLEMI
ncbi:hypothetical protein GLAREA_12939 [Glarea lozoyensis ATCC 20868]|uniref:Uncharacterized protein n=1 Tax=Glarea lozoyensis (strain ATCC 20868 / MF5171) TaxID=1116229 RepID=S3DE06_GLAL2|nr:uncharacterized protein GLAREA_12939 [Glarea lozoyensis ATCC 20868]EPE30216.1 hypothetical protein GLAREA_12939 [Glarea lozoyensis ATCC 20868]